jgi:hypothetical protein
MLRNKIISIVALERLAWLHPPGDSLAVEAAGTEVADSTEGGGGFRGRAFGSFGPYAYGDYPYYYGDDYEGGCYLVARRVLTRYGWRSRRVESCD